MIDVVNITYVFFMLKLFTENKRGRISYFLFLDFLQFDCYDYDSDGSHDFIGTFTTTLADMESQTQGGKEVSLLSRSYFPLEKENSLGKI